MKMIQSGRRALLAGAAVLALSAHAAGEAQVAPPSTVPVENFFAVADMQEPVMSPDGTGIAVLVRSGTGRRQLAVIDTTDLNNIKVVAGYNDQDIADVVWVNDRRLIYRLRDESESRWQQRGSGLFSVDRDGGDARTLLLMHGRAMETGTMVKSRALSPWEYRAGEPLQDGTDDVIVYRKQLGAVASRGYRELDALTPLRMNSRTGILRDAVKAPMPEHCRFWAFDRSGSAKVAIASHAGTSTVYIAQPDGAWKALTSFAAFGLSPDAFTLSGIGADGTIHVLHHVDDAFASRAVFRLDLETGKPAGEPLVAAKGFDIDPEFVEDRRHQRLLGAHYESDADGSVWFDKDFAALQAKLDKARPGMVNHIDPGACGCAQRVLVTSASDRQPPYFSLYDRKDDTLITIGASRRAIDARQMADTDFVRIKARDGHDLPLYVTKPHGKGPWPTVALVHGGPWLRGGHWDWNGEAQFLASRGYLVVRPEFRGSEGYGAALFSSGLKQWGLKMQDDIADATTWAAQKGLADPARTCIAGADYGGYATLMGLVRYPDLYRCGIAWAAVTDINLMYDLDTSDFSDEFKSYGMPGLIGDQTADAEQLTATSPLAQAARIKRPLLLAHGGIDRRVPIEHATKLKRALEANHAPFTWVEYADEGHGWSKPENRVDFYKRMEAFLAANIGPAAPPATAQAAQ